MTMDRLHRARADVAAAAQIYEARWTLRALRRVDPELHARFVRQRDTFDMACVTGTMAQVEQHAAAMCRGWVLATEALEKAQEPHDAYFEGFDAASGCRVLVGPQRAVAAQVPSGAIHITPDEVAALLGKNRLAAEVMRRWPGAEIVAVREGDAA